MDSTFIQTGSGFFSNSSTFIYFQTKNFEIFGHFFDIFLLEITFIFFNRNYHDFILFCSLQCVATFRTWKIR